MSDDFFAELDSELTPSPSLVPHPVPAPPSSQTTLRLPEPTDNALPEPSHLLATAPLAVPVPAFKKPAIRSPYNNDLPARPKSPLAANPWSKWSTPAPLSQNNRRLSLPKPPVSPAPTSVPNAPKNTSPTTTSPLIKWLNVPVVFPRAFEPQILPKLELNTTRIIPIGGLRTVGCNMTMIEHGDDILLVDGGFGFARGGGSPGMNYLIPDMRFLIPHAKRIKAMFVTHGHLDHIGALKNIIPALGFPPIYASPFTVAMIKKHFEEAGLRGKVVFHVINPDSAKVANVGPFKYEFFRVNHSIPDSCGIYIETPCVRIMHMGDYKLEFFPRLDRPVDLSNYARIAARGIDVLLEETTNSYKQEWTTSETKVSSELKQIIQDAPERVIIGNFSTLISRIQDVVSIAEALGRFVLINGRSMVECVAIARDLGYLKCKDSTMKMLDAKTLESIPESKQIITTTGAQGEEFGGLNNIARGDHATISIKPRDTIVLSSSIIPGNELAIEDLMNNLNRFGAKIITIKENEVHSGGHGGILEQRVVINLVKPRYVLPVHGNLSVRLLLKREVVKMGWDPKNVPILEDGSMLEFDSRRELIFGKKKIPLEELAVDGMSIGSLESRTVQDRIKLGAEGVLIVNMRDGLIESRGLFFPDDILSSHRTITEYLKKLLADKKSGDNDRNIREYITKDLSKMIMKTWDREPLIVVL